MRTLQIGNRTLGEGQPCFIIAEAGVNHNGDSELAHRLIDAAAAAGADAVKFQTFVPEEMTSPDAPLSDYQSGGIEAGETQIDMLRRLVLPRAAYPELIRHAGERGLIFLSTPFDADSADYLESLDLPAFKLSSEDVTNPVGLAHVARKGRPLLLSTGMASLAEVCVAVEGIRANGDPPLALLHCVSSYPTAPEDCNLRAVETLKRTFHVPVGWSDHTMGIDISIAAAALGADLIEKHFTLDRSLPGPDHQASLEPDELCAMVTGIRNVEAALGDGVKRARASELSNAAEGRRSLHWRSALPAGVYIQPDHLVALRPGTGIACSAAELVLGRTLRRNVDARSMVVLEDLQ